jgi:hypothetical protein
MRRRNASCASLPLALALLAGGVALVAGSAARAQTLGPITMPSGCSDSWDIFEMNENGDMVGNLTAGYASWDLNAGSCSSNDNGIFLYTHATGQTQLLPSTFYPQPTPPPPGFWQMVQPTNAFGLDDNGAVYIYDLYGVPWRRNPDATGTNTPIPTVTNGTTPVAPSLVTRDGQLMIAAIADSNGNNTSIALWRHNKQKDTYTVTTIKQPLPGGATTFQFGGGEYNGGGHGIVSFLNEHGAYLVTDPGPPAHSYIYQVQDERAVQVADLGVGFVPTALNNHGDATGYTVAPGAGPSLSQAIQAFVYHAQNSSSSGSPPSKIEMLNISGTCPSYPWPPGPIPAAINDSGTVMGTVCNLHYQPGLEFPSYVVDTWVRTSTGVVTTLGDGVGTVYPPVSSAYGCADNGFSWYEMVGMGMTNSGDIVGRETVLNYDNCSVSGFYPYLYQGWIYQP